MLKKIDPEKTDAWNKLQEHYETMQHTSMKDMFAHDPDIFVIQTIENIELCFYDSFFSCYCLNCSDVIFS